MDPETPSRRFGVERHVIEIREMSIEELIDGCDFVLTFIEMCKEICHVVCEQEMCVQISFFMKNEKNM